MNDHDFWTIDSIVVGQISPQGPVFPTTNSQGVKLPPPNGNGIIWTPGQNYADGIDGSIAPVTFQIPSQYSPNWLLPMTINATVVFPEEWYGQGCQIMGYVGGMLSALSNVFEVTADTAWEFNQMYLPFDSEQTNPAFPGYSFCIPFRISGDWTWTLKLFQPPRTEAPNLIPTRLELSFAVYPLPPNDANPNPLWPEADILRSQPDFGSSYPVVVQRYAFPDPYSVSTTGDLNQALNWYAVYMVTKIWNSGNGSPPNPYDSDLGQSGFGMNNYGGIFNLTQWSQGPPHPCNSFDLAAVLQLGCSIALSPTGSELLQSTWVFQHPRGYVLNGELYAQPQIIGCNNPFYLNPQFNQNPICQQPQDSTRSYFPDVAWVEVQRNQQSFVIDVTHAVNHPLLPPPPRPEWGGNNRTQYLALHLDPNGNQAATRNGDAINRAGNGLVGSCYQNPDYRLPRIGVFGTDMDPPLPPLPGALVPGEPNPESRKFIQASTDRSTRPSRFTSASLRPQIVAGIMSSALDKAVTIVYNQLYPSLESTARHFVFSSASTSDDFCPHLSLNIQVYNTQEGATTALADYLSSFSVKRLADHVRATPTSLGDISLSCKGTILLVHGNVYAKLQVILGSTQAIAPKSCEEDLLSAAVALDRHLSSGDRHQTSVPCGSVPFNTEPPKQVRKGTSFTLQVPSALPENIAMESSRDEKVIAFVSKPHVIMSCGPADSGGNLTFAAFSTLDTVEITVVRPHVDTLIPESAAFKVNVTDPED